MQKTYGDTGFRCESLTGQNPKLMGDNVSVRCPAKELPKMSQWFRALTTFSDYEFAFRTNVWTQCKNYEYLAIRRKSDGAYIGKVVRYLIRYADTVQMIKGVALPESSDLHVFYGNGNLKDEYVKSKGGLKRTTPTHEGRLYQDYYDCAVEIISAYERGEFVVKERVGKNRRSRC